MDKVAKNWSDIVARVAHGDEVAFLELSGLITGHLKRLRAYDFEDEWPDLIQELVISLLRLYRQSRLPEPGAFVTYVGAATRNRFFDRLRAHNRHGEGETEAWDRITQAAQFQLSAFDPGRETIDDVWRVIEKFPERTKLVVAKVYGEGMTNQEAAKATGIPLGTVKRALRDALTELRRIFTKDKD